MVLLVHLMLRLVGRLCKPLLLLRLLRTSDEAPTRHNLAGRLRLLVGVELAIDRIGGPVRRRIWRLVAGGGLLHQWGLCIVLLVVVSLRLLWLLLLLVHWMLRPLRLLLVGYHLLLAGRRLN